MQDDLPDKRLLKEIDRLKGSEEAVRTLIRLAGDDPDREGLKDTPNRVIRSYEEIFGGYTKDPESVFTVFDEPCDELVLMRGIRLYSTCEHHMLPFTGVAHVAYIPKGKVIGASKLVRLVEIYSRRLQIQERLTQQITQALDKYLQPLGSACIISCTHWCMACRGVRQSPEMVTNSLTGAFKEDPKTRQEFLQLIGGSL